MRPGGFYLRPLFPARAGVILKSQYEAQAEAAFPRASGGNSQAYQGQINFLTFSPRERG
ncbi:hypothetical protein HMPREF3198_02036 [Winkia neuii]|nr:hypothetical protein HMPREF3198_02036 [Winkia neuii]